MIATIGATRPIKTPRIVKKACQTLQRNLKASRRAYLWVPQIAGYAVAGAGKVVRLGVGLDRHKKRRYAEFGLGILVNVCDGREIIKSASAFHSLFNRLMKWKLLYRCFL